MQDQTKQILAGDARRLERAIVLRTVGEAGDRRLSQVELAGQLGEVETVTLTNAFARLAQEGVIELSDEDVHASSATIHLDHLGLIAI